MDPGFPGPGVVVAAPHPSSLDPLIHSPHSANGSQETSDAIRQSSLSHPLNVSASSKEDGQASLSTHAAPPASFSALDIGLTTAADSQAPMLPTSFLQQYPLSATPPALSAMASPFDAAASSPDHHQSTTSSLAQHLNGSEAPQASISMPVAYHEVELPLPTAAGSLADPASAVAATSLAVGAHTSTSALPPPATPGTPGPPVQVSAGESSATGPVLPDAAPRASPGWAEWGLQTLRKVRQTIAGQLAGPPSSVDKDLAFQIAELQTLQGSFKQLLGLANALAYHLFEIADTQRQTHVVLAQLAALDPALEQQHLASAEALKVLHKNGLTLVGAMNFFSDNIHTLAFKSIEDTLATWADYCSACRDVEGATAMEAERVAHARRRDELAEALRVKLRLLDENKVKVLKKQLVLFHSATCAFFAGNEASLGQLLREAQSGDSDAGTASPAAPSLAREGTAPPLARDGTPPPSQPQLSPPAALGDHPHLHP